MTPATPAPALPAAVAVSAAAAGIFRYCSGWPVSVFGGPESSVLAWTACWASVEEPKGYAKIRCVSSPTRVSMPVVRGQQCKD